MPSVFRRRAEKELKKPQKPKGIATVNKFRDPMSRNVHARNVKRAHFFAGTKLSRPRG